MLKVKITTCIVWYVICVEIEHMTTVTQRPGEEKCIFL